MRRIGSGRGGGDKRRNGVGGDSFGAAEGTEGLVGGGLEADGVGSEPGGPCKIVFNAIGGRAEAWFLSDNGDVEIIGAIAGLADVFSGLAEEEQGGGIFPARVGIGKKVADIAQAGGTEKGVGGGVAEDIGIGMTDEPARVIEADAAKGERTALGKPVDIVAETDTKGGERRLGRGIHGSGGENGFEERLVSGPGQFGIGKGIFEEANRMAADFDSGEVIGDLTREIGMGGAEKGGRECLGCFHGPEGGAVEERTGFGGSGGIFGKGANGIGHAVGEGTGVPVAQQKLMKLANEIGANGGAGAVMDENPLGGIRQSGEACLDRELARGPAGGEVDRQLGTVLGEDSGEGFLLGGITTDDHELSGDTTGGKGANNMGKSGYTGEGEKDFVGGLRTHAGAAAPGEQQDGGGHDGKVLTVEPGKATLRKWNHRLRESVWNVRPN